MRFLLYPLFTAALLSAQNSSPEQLFNKAMAAQQQGDLSTAVSIYQDLLKSQPKLVPARANLAAAEMQLGQTEQAIADYRLAAHQDPGNLQLIAAFANCLNTAHRYQDSVTLLRPVVKLHQDDTDAAFLLGDALIHIGQSVEGAQLLEHVGSARKDANAYMLAAITQIQNAAYEKADADAQAAVRIDPTMPGVYTVLGMTKGGRGDDAAAKTAYGKALAANPNDFDANLRLGTLLRYEGDYAGAKPYLLHALFIDPSSLSARFEVALLKKEDGHQQEAIADLEKIEHEAPNLSEPHAQLAILYSREHRKDDAQRERAAVDQLAAEKQKQMSAAQAAQQQNDPLAGIEPITTSLSPK